MRNADSSSNRIITTIALMVKTITEEDTGSRLSSELSPLPGRKQDKTTTTKYAEMIIARGRTMETLTRTTIAKKGRGLQVKEINCSADGVSPKVRGNIGTQAKSTSCLQNVAMLALSNPILGVCPRTG